MCSSDLIPGAFLTRTDQAASILDEVGSGNLGIEYDVYQAQREEGNLAVTLERHMPRIWHMQVADVPSRAEPGTGEINYPYLFRRIAALDYRGWIGCDYEPSGPTGESFGWMQTMLPAG